MAVEKVYAAEGTRRRKKAWQELQRLCQNGGEENEEGKWEWFQILIHHSRAIGRGLDSTYWLRPDRCLPWILVQRETWLKRMDDVRWAQLVLMSVCLRDCLLNRWIWSDQVSERKLFLPFCFRSLFIWDEPVAARYDFSHEDPMPRSYFRHCSRDGVLSLAFLLGRFDSSVHSPKIFPPDDIAISFPTIRRMYQQILMHQLYEAFNQGRTLLSAEISQLSSTISSALPWSLRHPALIIASFLLR